MPGQRWTAYPKTVGPPSLERQGSIFVEPDAASGRRNCRGSGCNWREVGVSLSEVHQRRVGDRFGTTRVSNRHELSEQGIVFRMVPANVHGQPLAEINDYRTGEPIPEHNNEFIGVLVCIGLVLASEDQRSAETVSVLTLWK